MEWKKACYRLLILGGYGLFDVFSLLSPHGSTSMLGPLPARELTDLGTEPYLETLT